MSTELQAELIDAVAAIKAKTDNLPASPAAVGSAMTLTPAYDRAKDDVLTPLTAVDGKVDSILEDTSTSIPTSIAELPTDADVQAAAEAAIVAQPATLTAAYDHAKDDVLTPLAVVDTVVDGIAADYARRTGDYNAVAPLDATATQLAAQAAIVAEAVTLAADQPLYAPTTWRDLEPLAKTGEAASAINVYQPLRASDYVEARNDLIIDIEERTLAIEGKVNTVDGILDTILPLIQRVYRYFFNKRTHTNSSVVVYADDGVTPDATMAVSGDTTTVTKSAPE